MGLTTRAVLLAIVLALVSIFSSMVNAQPGKQQEALLQKKITRLQAKAGSNKGVIELDSKAFEEVMSNPRNYSMVVLFTAIGPEFQCVPCLNFDPEFKLVASGWSKLPDKSKLFFGSLDFKAGQHVFQQFGMNSAPAVLFFPPSNSPPSNPQSERYDFTRSGFIAEPFAAWVNEKAGTNVKVRRPIDFVAWGVKIAAGLGVAGVLFLLYRKANKVSSSKYLWSAGSLFTIFVMISGHMWNQSRNPPYTVNGRDGRPSFIAQGFQNQFGLESQVIAVLYAALTGCVIVLISVVPKVENPHFQRVVVWISMGMFALLFSVLIHIFRVKNPAYPFTLMFH